ncbi:hypothetical protein FGO68_gene12623 [Halteria grandinella]|uniref:Protein kinase domain-containing protein n=1 Tax=Halteria grandinella TaxID=5974 RepID=A0A8J8T8I0_HALGN|nr:hypothetical protein FGO68_gene12623 [Halteria grandinella]
MRTLYSSENQSGGQTIINKGQNQTRQKIGFTLRTTLGTTHQFVVVTDLGGQFSQKKQPANEREIQNELNSPLLLKAAQEPITLNLLDQSRQVKCDLGQLVAQSINNVLQKQLKLREWFKALHGCVIRCDPLSKYKIIRQIPMGQIGLQNEFEAVYHVQKKCLKKQVELKQQNMPVDADITGVAVPNGSNAHLISGITVANLLQQSKPFKSDLEEANKIPEGGASALNGTAVAATTDGLATSQKPPAVTNTPEYVLKTYTVRVISKKKIDNRQLEEEGQRIATDIKIHRALKLCSNVIKLLKVHESAQNVYLFLDYEGGGSIGDLIDQGLYIQEDNARLIIEQLLLAVDFMSLKGISHRDLNPSTLLIHHSQNDLFNIQIGDFTKALFIQDAEARPFSIKDSFNGRVGYIAPEILLGHKPTMRSDIFSVGAILYKIVMMKELFKGSDLKLAIRKNRDCNLQKADLRLREHRGVSQNCKDLILLLLNKEPLMRPTAIEALSHPWFSIEKKPLQASILLNQLLAERKRPNLSDIEKIQRLSSQVVGHDYQEKSGENHQQNRTQQELFIDRQSFEKKLEAGGINNLTHEGKDQKASLLKPHRTLYDDAKGSNIRIEILVPGDEPGHQDVEDRPLFKKLASQTSNDPLNLTSSYLINKLNFYQLNKEHRNSQECQLALMKQQLANDASPPSRSTPQLNHSVSAIPQHFKAQHLLATDNHQTYSKNNYSAFPMRSSQYTKKSSLVGGGMMIMNQSLAASAMGVSNAAGGGPLFMNKNERAVLEHVQSKFKKQVSVHMQPNNNYRKGSTLLGGVGLLAQNNQNLSLRHHDSIAGSQRYTQQRSNNKNVLSNKKKSSRIINQSRESSFDQKPLSKLNDKDHLSIKVNRKLNGEISHMQNSVKSIRGYSAFSNYKMNDTQKIQIKPLLLNDSKMDFGLDSNHPLESSQHSATQKIERKVRPQQLSTFKQPNKKSSSKQTRIKNITEIINRRCRSKEARSRRITISVGEKVEAS